MKPALPDSASCSKPASSSESASPAEPAQPQPARSPAKPAQYSLLDPPDAGRSRAHRTDGREIAEQPAAWSTDSQSASLPRARTTGPAGSSRPRQSAAAGAASSNSAAPHAARAPSRRRHWLALHLPDLPLDALHPGGWCGQPGQLLSRQRIAVISGSRVKTEVVCASEAAREAGVMPGMRASAAAALATGLSLVRQDQTLERAALEGIATWAGQFSSLVCLHGRGGLLIETGGSQRLFGGLARLIGQVLDGLAELGYRAMPGAAPTAAAAWLLARGGDPEPVRRMSELAGRLGVLPVQLLDPDERTLEALHGMGLHRLADCRRLPRDGFARRFGPELLAHMDEAYGYQPEALQGYQPPLVVLQAWCKPWALL